MMSESRQTSSEQSSIPLWGPDLHQWKPGERVAAVSYPKGAYGGDALRPGVVVGVEEELRRHRFLRIRFDDGEERRINPDVMRHSDRSER